MFEDLLSICVQPQQKSTYLKRYDVNQSLYDLNCNVLKKLDLKQNIALNPVQVRDIPYMANYELEEKER